MKTPIIKLSVGALALHSVKIFAAATLVSEMSHLNVTTAGAGSAVLSETASAAYTNPAATASIEEHAVTVNLATMALDVSYDDHRDDSLSSDNAGGLQPYGSLYYVAPYTERTAFGIALTATGGSALDYGENYAGALGLNELSLTLTQLNPSLAYQLTENLNVGLGLQVEHARFEQSALNYRATIETESVALGYNLGATYQLSSKHDIGLSYRSKLNHKMDGELSLSRSYDASISLINAARLELSGLHQVTQPLSLVWSLGQEYWHENQATAIQVGGAGLDKPRKFDDVWFASTGMRFDITDKLRLEAGIGYVSSPLDDPSIQSTDLPVDEQRRYSVGATYHWSKSTSLTGYYSYVDYGSPQISSGQLNGEYNNHNQFFGIQINHNF